MLNPIINDEDRAVLATIAAAPQPPGSIVGDFERLLALLGKEGIPVSPKTAEFGIASLPVLNALLAHPAAVGLARGRQKSYPHLDGLHMLLRHMQLGRLDRSGSTPRMVLDAEMMTRWTRLNPTERYFTLLEYWWNCAELEGDWLGFRALNMAEFRLKLLEWHRPGGRSMPKDPRQLEALFHLVGMKQVALAQMFGMLDITQGRIVSGEGWKIASMVSTPWGLTCSSSYYRSFQCTATGRLEDLLHLSDDEAIEEAVTGEDDDCHPAFHHWADAVTPYFPAWKHGLGEPEAPEPFCGSVTMKVSLGKAWRRVVMPADSSFVDLASFILEIFNFDFDHLYQFDYQDEYGARCTLVDPQCSNVDMDEASADAVQLGEIGLYPKQLIDFCYDFGDNWQFKVQIEALDRSGSGIKPRLLAKEGKAPAQYSY